MVQTNVIVIAVFGVMLCVFVWVIPAIKRFYGCSEEEEDDILERGGPIRQVDGVTVVQAQFDPRQSALQSPSVEMIDMDRQQSDEGQIQRLATQDVVDQDTSFRFANYASVQYANSIRESALELGVSDQDVPVADQV